MNSKKNIILITPMRRLGDTGVQAYVNSFHKYLTQHGFSSTVITPFSFSPPVVFSIFSIRRLLQPVMSEWSVGWGRYWRYFFLKQVVKRHLKNQVQNSSPTIIYAQDPISAKAALEAREKPEQKVFMVVHYNVSQADEWLEKGKIKFDSPLYNSIKLLERTTISKLDGIIYVSQFMKSIIEDTIPQARFLPSTCIPCFTGTPALEETEGSQRDLINIGTLEGRKNQAYLLQVLACAKRKGYNYSLTLIGDGPQRQYLENLSQSLGISDQVKFLGSQKNAAKFLYNHRVYVHSSLIENLPISLLEALACNLPILASAVGGIPEIFTEGKEGYYWSLDNPESGANKLINLLENKEIYQNQAKAAGERFRAQFEMNLVANRLLSFLSN